ncbi:MAG: hypothetical protein KTR31_17020 [Myxococcales bacterium]|nr:hypothetical protein [Myxococcales bacterium]
MRPTVWILALLLLPGLAEAGKKNKKKKNKGKQDAGPKIGWVAVGENGGSCYFPPDFAGLATGPKRMEWQNTRNAIMGQWRGEKGDGVAFDDKVIVNMENVLLGEPALIEAVATENAAECEKAMSGGGVDAWEAWLKATPGRLTAGQCPTPPMDFTLYDYLSINHDWQIPVSVCKGDHVNIHASATDYYRLDKDGDYINADGAAEGSVAGLPCDTEMCRPGMLIMRFRGEGGMSQILPVGLDLNFRVPSHGTIDVMINDASMSDNDWKTVRGIQHHTSIEYSPAGG